MRTAHRAEVRLFRTLLRQGFVVEFTSGFRIEAQIELIFPPELKRAFETTLSRSWAPGCPLARSAACAAIL